jgi:hypothetical protein
LLICCRRSSWRVPERTPGPSWILDRWHTDLDESGQKVTHLWQCSRGLGVGESKAIKDLDATTDQFSPNSHNVIPPRGYSICGISGSCGSWVDGLSVLITR